MKKTIAGVVLITCTGILCANLLAIVNGSDIIKGRYNGHKMAFYPYLMVY